VTDFMDGRGWLWWDRIQYACATTKRRRVELTLGSGTKSFVFDSPDDRTAAAEKIIAQLKPLGLCDRSQAIQCILERLDVAANGAPPSEYAPLEWDEVRFLLAQGVEFGAHSCTHPLLTTVNGESALRREICGSRRRLAEELRTPIQHFAYPDGDFDERTVAAVAGCGFRSGATTRTGINRKLPSPFLLERIPVECGLEIGYFAELLAGLHL
jgi:peptidoglycan/xylan/chitin deacetylase (PgdA/CDA1 family)